MHFKRSVLQLSCHDCVKTKQIQLPVRVRFDLLNGILFRHIQVLLKICTTLNQITDRLQQQFPEYKHLITKETVQSIIRLNYEINPIQIKKDTSIRIERKYSIFIDESTVTMNTYDTRPLSIYIMCAISSKGIQKLSINLIPHCVIEFTSSILQKLKNKTIPFQIIVKPSIHQKIQVLFSYPTCIHSLMTYPICSFVNPSKKCILKLSSLLPDKSHIHSVQDIEQLFKTNEITSVNCSSWIYRYLQLLK